MPDQAGTFERLGEVLAQTVTPIATLMSDEQLQETFAGFGVDLPDEILSHPGFAAARASMSSAAGQLQPLVTELGAAVASDDPVRIISAGASVVAQSANVISSFQQLGPALQAAQPTLPGVTAAQLNAVVAGLPKKLEDLLFASMLELVPVVAAVMNVLGIVERVYDPGDPNDPTKPEHEQVSVRLDRIPRLVTSPVEHLRDLYHWGDAAFDAVALFTALEGALARLGLPVLMQPPAGGAPALLEAFGLDVHRVAGSPPALGFEIVLPGSVDQTIEFPVSPPTWTATLGLKGTLRAHTAGTIRPPLAIEVSSAAELEVRATAELHAEPPEPLVILGQAGGSRLEFGKLSIEGGVLLRWSSATGSATGEPLLDGKVTRGKLVIDASSGDGFIRGLLGGGRIEAGFDVGFAFAPDTGVRFHGSGALEIQVPTHVAIGPVEVQAIYLMGSVDGSTVPIELSAGFTGTLGPLTAAVDRLGVEVKFTFPAGGGNLGPLQLDLGFKPPTGVGLAIDAGVVKGGGFLSIDADRGEYSGFLELALADVIEVKAIGLITTRLADGGEGFSLLLLIFAELGSGIQLGYGFTLLGVGGLMGLNRTMALQPLMEGVRTGALESVMFPKDVVANAPRIISDLRRLFPPRKGTFLIGPMGKLGWGTPTLVSVSVGVIIEVPGNIAILGILKVALPAEDAALIVLQVNFAGAIEFDKRRVYFFAALFESRVLFITLEGELGLLVAWGDDPDFVISVGGFHPQFVPPPLPFPSPRRIAIDILNQPLARIRVEGYFAVTSNTVQFGARAELFFGFSALSVEGHIAFDALFQFSPFAFVIQISASVSLKAFGFGLFSIRLRFSLAGPTPWRASGSGSISLLFFEIEADFDITWGEERDTALPPIDVMPIVAGEIAKRSNWTAELPAGKNLLVTLRALPSTDDLVLHPVGTLHVRQRAVPLERVLGKVGNQKPRDAERFTLSVLGGGLEVTRRLEDQFAAAQFEELDDAERLSRPAFEPMPAGAELSVDDNKFASAAAVKRTVRYEEIIIDTSNRRFVRRFRAVVSGLFAHFLHGNAVSLSPLAQQQKKLKVPFDDVVVVSGAKFAVANARDNTLVTDGAVFTSRSMALSFLADHVATDPNAATQLHVIPAFELQATS